MREIHQQLFVPDESGGWGTFGGLSSVYVNRLKGYTSYKSLLENLASGLEAFYEENLPRWRDEKDGIDIPY